jgi:hypothetical protein
METVYLETTVVSYLLSEPSRDLIIAGHQQITWNWWQRQRPAFLCVVSQLVLDEAIAGNPQQATKRLAALRDLPVVPVTPAAVDLADAFIRGGAVPQTAARDALHIAVATVNKLDYLVTWNCRHIANAQVLRKLQQVCASCGYVLPIVCTLEELMGESVDES